MSEVCRNMLDNKVHPYIMQCRLRWRKEISLETWDSSLHSTGQHHCSLLVKYDCLTSSPHSAKSLTKYRRPWHDMSPTPNQIHMTVSMLNISPSYYDKTQSHQIPRCSYTTNMANEAPTPNPSPETLEALQTRHKKEQRDLLSRITQKKKQATKKTRKGVNDECERLERELKERQNAELAALHGPPSDTVQAEDEEEQEQRSLQTSMQHTQEQLAELNRGTQTPQIKTASTNGDAQEARKKKPNRAKARLARRAADTAAMIAAAEAEAANAPNPREVERERMAQQLEKRGLVVQEIRADGHCLYAAVADQLSSRELGLTPTISVTIAGSEGKQVNGGLEAYKKVRYAAADFIQQHPESFDGFTEDPLPEHVRKIRETGEWGGHLELLALARSYGVRICVLHSDGQVNEFEPEEKDDQGQGKVEEIWLGYYKHSHGLGEHYNSLRS